MEKLAPTLKQVNLKGIGYSDRPRRVEGSYMPVFLAGETLARSLSASHGIPCFAFSHQEGHLAAGLWSLDIETYQPFYAFHLSGGTTELLKVKPRPDLGFDEKIVGETADISLGQFIDRIGVAMGLPFPAGPALEELALSCEAFGETPFDIPFTIKTSVKTGESYEPHQPVYSLSLSGPETHVQRLLETQSPERIALSLFHMGGKLLARLLTKAQNDSSLPMVLLVGGVASNSIVRKVMEEALPRTTLHFAIPGYCSDNAVGTAALTVQALKRNASQ